MRGPDKEDKATRGWQPAPQPPLRRHSEHDRACSWPDAVAMTQGRYCTQRKSGCALGNRRPSEAAHMGVEVVSDFLAAGGEIGALTRAFDWSKTSIGPPETWPQSLRVTVRLVLTSRDPMFLLVGAGLI